MELIAPSKKDPRLYMTVSLSLFVTLSQLYLGFSQTRLQILVAVVSCVTLDVLFGVLTTNKLHVPLSGFISSLSLCLLLDTGNRVLPFLLATTLAISSKYLLRFRDRHFFNPTNFAVAVLLLLNIGSITPGYQWGGGTTALWIVLSMGNMLLYRVRRLALLGSFLCFFTLSALLRATYFGESFPWAFGLMTGAPFQLFTFFMLTDPRTTPQRPRSQVMFALAVVLVDFTLRQLRVPHALFMSLFYVDIFVLLAALAGHSFGVHSWTLKSHQLRAPGSVGTPSEQEQSAVTVTKAL